MITCHARYIIDPAKLDQFETYSQMWISLVDKVGGHHHGYFMPVEPAGTIAMALATYSCFAALEAYRDWTRTDPGCAAAFRYAEETGCIVSAERNFFRPRRAGIQAGSPLHIFSLE